MNKEAVIKKTRDWIMKSVVGLGTCPFAKPVIDKDSLELRITQAKHPTELMEDLLDAMVYLSAKPISQVNTLILIHPEVLTDFDDYLDFVADLGEVMKETELDEDFQVATFHPDYQFEGTRTGAKQNYTNRSPYPMLHILRQVVINEALYHYPDPENIPLRNIETFEALSWEEIEELYR